MAETYPMLQVELNSADTLADPPTRMGTASVNVTSDGLTNTVSKSRIFRPRTLLLICAPSLITGLYIVIWRQFMVINDSDLKFGAPHQQWLFAAWFVIGVFGLSWSKYGLVGVEHAMLQIPCWRPGRHDEVAWNLHKKTHWTGPTGWFSWIPQILRRRGRVDKLFGLLSFLSFLIFVGLPLSGLTLSLSEGFIANSAPPLVVGRTKENFYDTKPGDMLDLLVNSWKTGSPPIVPGYGVLYTPRNVSRSDYDNLLKFPNTLPLTKSIPELYLAPQAQYPIAGKPWGLRASYNCSIVEDVSTFTILNQRQSSILDVRQQRSSTDSTKGAILQPPSGESWISAFINNPNSDSAPGSNIWSYVEIGRSAPEEQMSDPIYNNNSKGVVEYSLWQVRLTNPYNETQYRPNYHFNETLQPTIKGMPSPFLPLGSGTWILNMTFFQAKKKNGTVDGTVNITDYLGLQDPDVTLANLGISEIQSVPYPIGVRCEYDSATGTVKLDPRTSSFSSFDPEPPIWDSNAQYTTPPLGFSVADVLTARFFDIFTSTGSPPPVVISNSPAYESYVQPQILLESIMLVFGLDALHIMYGGGMNGFDGALPHENLTSSRKGWIIAPGNIPPFIPLIFFVPWTLGCLVLAAFYGFKSDRLDNHSLEQMR